MAAAAGASPAPVTPVAPPMDAATAAAAAAMQERIEALERWRLQQLQESFARQHEAERAAEAVEAGLDPQSALHGDRNSVVIAGMRGGPGVETAVPKRRRSTGNSDGYLMALRMRGRRLEVESLTAEVMTLKSAMERRWNELQQAGGESRSSVIDQTLGVPAGAPSSAHVTQLMHETETSLQRTPFRGVHESITKVRATHRAGARGDSLHSRLSLPPPPGSHGLGTQLRPMDELVTVTITASLPSAHRQAAALVRGALLPTPIIKVAAATHDGQYSNTMLAKLSEMALLLSGRIDLQDWKLDQRVTPVLYNMWKWLVAHFTGEWVPPNPDQPPDLQAGAEEQRAKFRLSLRHIVGLGVLTCTGKPDVHVHAQQIEDQVRLTARSASLH